jgi:SAM-dependent methyltransferase
MGSGNVAVDPRLLEFIVCPRDRTNLREAGRELVCELGHTYGVVDGVPVLLVEEVAFTHCDAQRALAATRADVPQLMPAPIGNEIDPFVNKWIAATNGALYSHLAGKLQEYPIPNLRLPPGDGRLFLDVGCSWGRWCIAAARAGYRPIGVDPSLGGIRAARHVAAQLRADALFVVGDGRYLPFRDNLFDQAFSYSVLQHLSKDNTRTTLREIHRVLRPGGQSLIQMANKLGPRSLYNQMRHWFVKTGGFEVRYWFPGELLSAFRQELGPTEIEVDGFFSLNPQVSDLRFLPWKYRVVVRSSEALRITSRVLPFMRLAADSLYLRSRLPATKDQP